MILPLAMLVFVLAYAYTDFLDTSGPLQSALRAMDRLAIRELLVSAGALAARGRSGPEPGAVSVRVHAGPQRVRRERSQSLAEAAQSLGLPRARVWWHVTWPVARPAVVAGCTRR